MKKLITAMALCALSLNAMAITLKEAKQQGLVGERTDGYVGYVVSSPSSDVTSLVKNVNNKRKAKFASTAKKTGATMDQVKVSFYKRALSATQSGHYVQNARGQWEKK